MYSLGTQARRPLTKGGKREKEGGKVGDRESSPSHNLCATQKGKERQGGNTKKEGRKENDRTKKDEGIK